MCLVGVVCGVVLAGFALRGLLPVYSRKSRKTRVFSDFPNCC